MGNNSAEMIREWTFDKQVHAIVQQLNQLVVA